MTWKSGHAYGNRRTSLKIALKTSDNTGNHINKYKNNHRLTLQPVWLGYHKQKTEYIERIHTNKTILSIKTILAIS